MYGYSVKGFGFLRLLTGFSKGLTLANNILPIYKKAKPFINNAKEIISSLKSINLNEAKTERKKKITSNSTNNPTFFI